MSTLVRISPAEAHAKMTAEGFTYVDVRTPEEFAEGRPAGSINVPLGDEASALRTRSSPPGSRTCSTSGPASTPPAARSAK